MLIEDDVEHFRGARGWAHVWRLAPGLLRIEIGGHGGDEVYAFLRPIGDREMAEGRGLTVFYDTTQLASFDKSFRLSMANWMAETRGHHFQYVLVKNPLVSAAIKTAMMIIGGGVQVTSNRQQFERRMHETAESRRSLTDASVQARLPRI